MAGVLLSSNIRSNLLALQGTADLLNTSQNRLSTGKKVNSALDNASSYFTSQNLSDKASALTSLQDGISTGLSTIKQANQGLTTISSLLKSAKAVAQSALSNAGAAGYSAKGSGIFGGTPATGQTQQQAAGAALLTSNTTSSGVSNADALAAADTLTFSSVSNNVTKSFTFTVGAGSTVNDLVTAVNNSGVGSAQINADGSLSFSSTGNLSVTASGAANATKALGFSGLTGGKVTTTQGSQAATTDYTSQLNDLLNQITQTATDSGYNGVNLLVGGQSNNLNVKFDDKSSSSLSVNSTDVTLNGLGITNPTQLGSGNAQSYIDAISTAITNVQNLAGTYGTKQTILQARSDFTKNVADILQTGSDNLVAADNNEEAANVLALQTRQSLSQSALSLANQANQAVLQLLR